MNRPTEAEDPLTSRIGEMETKDALRLMNAGDLSAVEAVGRAVTPIAALVEEIVARFLKGGRLIYVGAGTSGRLGVLDASEIPPTFGLQPGRVVGVIAGGPEALEKAVEGLEDVREAGADALTALELGSDDVVIGLTASGSTPFTIGAVAAARESGTLTACVTCDPESEIVKAVDKPIVVEVGPEFIAGSTRLKAGTAQKLVLNMISTMTMVRLGYTSGNLMTNLWPGNQKLRERAARILASEIEVPAEVAAGILDECGGDLRVAIVARRAGVSPAQAAEALISTGQVIEAAVSLLTTETN